MEKVFLNGSGGLTVFLKKKNIMTGETETVIKYSNCNMNDIIAIFKHSEYLNEKEVFTNCVYYLTEK